MTTTVQTRRQIAEEKKRQQKEAATGIQSREILAATFDQETVSRGRDKQEIRSECRDGNMLRTKELMSGNGN